MCGLAGFIASVQSKDGNRDAIQRMSSTLVHRGPDDSGFWIDEKAIVALAHRRLAIQDITSLGHQPMMSESGRYVIVYNGEIYNFRVLQIELSKRGHRFRGHSDTEVLLAAIEAWGVRSAIGRFVGMFAFALWDRKDRTLILARDRIGEKPLYYGWQKSTFIFGSELKALRQHPDWEGDIDRDVLTLYMRYGYVPTPYSIYRGIYKLVPGTFLEVSLDAGPRTEIQPTVYWSAAQVAREEGREVFEGSDVEAIDSLEQLLFETLDEKLLSDVPLGAFLSGGYDSSLVAALMQNRSDGPVKTFTIGFQEDAYNEAQHAASVARYLGTDHTELYISADTALGVIPDLPLLYDEPFADSSQIPTLLVSQLAKKHVTVALSGDGGDELFGGYNRYVQGSRIIRKVGNWPHSVRGLLAMGAGALSPQAWDRVYQLVSPLLPRRMHTQLPGDKLHKLAGLLQLEGYKDVYQALVSQWNNPEKVVLGGKELPLAAYDQINRMRYSQPLDYMMFADLIAYLPDDILVKLDRASMGVSLETRVPLLDHRIVEFAWRLPHNLKVRDGKGKWILRQVLYRHIPSNILERPKMGFGVPIDRWLRGPLKEWAGDLLAEARLRQESFFDAKQVHTKWDEHQRGGRNWSHHLWCVLMFESWLGTLN